MPLLPTLPFLRLLLRQLRFEHAKGLISVSYIAYGMTQRQCLKNCGVHRRGGALAMSSALATGSQAGRQAGRQAGGQVGGEFSGLWDLAGVGL